MAGRRETAAQNLFELATGAATGVAQLRAKGRRLVSYDDVDVNQLPAVYQSQVPEMDTKLKDGPTKRVMNFLLWVYTSDLDNAVPASQLNDMVDAIDDALRGDALTGRQTLSGACAAAFIEGGVEFYEGVSQNKSIAIIPVAVVLP